MNKKVNIIILLVIVAAGLIWFGLNQSNQNKETEGPLKIGVIAPLTGPAARLGEWNLEGINKAKEEINTEGGINGRLIELIIEDGKCTGSVGINSYKKLRDLDRVNYIIGPLCLAVRIPVLKIAGEDKVVIITTGLGHSSDPSIRPYTFNALPSVEAVAKRIIEFAVKDLGYKKISLLYSQDEYGVENEISIKKLAKEFGLEIVTVEKHARGAADLRTQILKFKNDGSEAILATTYPADYVVFLKQSLELGLNKQILAGSVLQAPDVSKMQAETGQKIYYSYPITKSETPSIYVGSGYDSLELLVNALKSCKAEDVRCVEKVLASTDNYQGVNGPITFDIRGNNAAANSIEIKVLDKGKFQRLDEIK